MTATADLKTVVDQENARLRKRVRLLERQLTDAQPAIKAMEQYQQACEDAWGKDLRGRV